MDIGGGGGGGNCNSGKIKSRSRKRSVICVNSKIKPRSSAYLDKNSYEINFYIIFLSNQIKFFTLSLGIGESSGKKLFNCTLYAPSRTSIRLGPHI